MKNRHTGLNVRFGARWGRLQSRALYCLVDHCGEAKTHEISRYCWDGKPTDYQIDSQRRAARSIGARAVRREGREWIWQLDCN
jgi:hypothetical protein